MKSCWSAREQQASVTLRVGSLGLHATMQCLPRQTVQTKPVTRETLPQVSREEKGLGKSKVKVSSRGDLLKAHERYRKQSHRYLPFPRSTTLSSMRSFCFFFLLGAQVPAAAAAAQQRTVPPLFLVTPHPSLFWPLAYFILVHLLPPPLPQPNLIHHHSRNRLVHTPSSSLLRLDFKPRTLFSLPRSPSHHRLFPPPLQRHGDRHISQDWSMHAAVTEAAISVRPWSLACRP